MYLFGIGSRLWKYFLFTLLLLAPFGLLAQIKGCTDPLSLNYNPAATENDGSCVYAPTSVTPVDSYDLGSSIPESSGLIFWNDQLFTHNDNTDTKLYALDTSNAHILDIFSLLQLENKDWEALSQDEDYIYIGDFGNNAHGNRSDLKIYRIDKNSLMGGHPQVDVIQFAYGNQTNFSGFPVNTTDFDCEAFIVSEDKIFLFTKQWGSANTVLYTVSKLPGNYTAQAQDTLEINGLVTGATYTAGKNLLVLSGYSASLQPFLYLLYDFSVNEFFSGNKRKLSLSLPFHQIEGIATKDGINYYLTNEHFQLNGFFSIDQQLHTVDLNAYLSTYLNSLSTENFVEEPCRISVYPNPASGSVTIDSKPPLEGSEFFIIAQTGKIVLRGKLEIGQKSVDISSLASGMYFLKISGRKNFTFKLMIK